MGSNSKIDLANFIISIVGMSLALIFQIFFFYRFKFKADKAAILILLTYLLVMILRVFQYGEMYSGFDLF